MTKTEAAVVRHCMRRYREWARKYPVTHAYVIAGDRRGYNNMSESAADSIRACHAHVEATKKK